MNLDLQAMPAGSVLLFRDEGNNLSVRVTGFGFTPGSSHTVELMRGHQALTDFSKPGPFRAAAGAAGVSTSCPEQG
jgi:hypothetical protein